MVRLRKGTLVLSELTGMQSGETGGRVRNNLSGSASILAKLRMDSGKAGCRFESNLLYFMTGIDGKDFSFQIRRDEKNLQSCRQKIEIRSPEYTRYFLR